MGKVITSLFLLALLAVSSAASAVPVQLVAHNQRSASGTRSTLVWLDCGPTGTGPGGAFVAPCIDPNNSWVVANGVTGSTATWDWDPVNRVLTGTGLYWATTYISSEPSGSSILGDKVMDLVINLTGQTTEASSYDCVEGTFVAGVGANACGNYSLGFNFIDESTTAYNVGGDPYCVQRTLGGDDSPLTANAGTVRGVSNRVAGGGCDTTHSAFPLYTLVQDNLSTGGTLIISNGICIGAPGAGTEPQIYAPCSNANWMTFQAVPEPGAASDAVTTPVNTPITINVLANDTGFANPVTVTISTAPQNGTAVVNGSPGDPSLVRVVYTPTADFQGIDTFQYAVTDGTASDVATVTVSVALVVDSSAFAEDWPGFQANPAHTGYVSGSLNTSQFALKWQITAANGQTLNPVAVGDGKVYVSPATYFGNSGLYAYAADSGANLWHVDYVNLSSVNPPGYANGRVYIQTGKSTSSIAPYLRAYDARTGQLAFQTAFGAQWEDYFAPTIVDDVVYVNGGTYGGMYAFSAIDGTQKWFLGLNQYDQWTPAVDSIYAYAYLGEYSPALYVLNRSTGQLAFSIPDPNFDWNGWSMNLAPVLGGANDVIAIHDGRLIRFDTANRVIAWERQRNFTGQPSVANGVIYAIDAGALTAWDQAGGTLLWSWSAPGDTLAGPLIVTDTHVLVSGSNKVYAVKLSDHLSDWNYAASGALALGGHTLYIASANGRLTSIRVAPPGAYDDTATAYLSTPLNIDVLANDDGFVSPVTVNISTAPQNGTAVVNGSPGNPSVVNVTYTPAAGFLGVDTFQYSADDGTLSDTATVTVTVDAPQANPDLAETHLYTPIAVDVLKNDLGFSDPVTVTITSIPQHGTAVVAGSPGNATGLRINYTPAGGFTGSDSLQYQVTNGINTGSATVSITVLPYKAFNDEYYALSNNSTYLYVATNDVGFQEPVTLTILNGPAQGSAYIYDSPGSRSNVLISYYANSGSYTTTITYSLSDGIHTDTATATIHVVPYIAQNDEAITGAGFPVTIDVAQNDLGFNYSRTIGLFTNPQHGTAVAQNYYYGGPIIYTPEPGFLGDDTFQYAIDDGTYAAIATVTVHVINDADNDHVDDGFDNCLGFANGNQRDADGDGYGSMCDADFNNDRRVNFADLAAFRSKFATADPNVDLNGSGIVNFADLALFRTLFGKPPGPSAIAQ